MTGGEGDERRQAATLALATAENQVRQLTAKLESFKQSEEELRGATREAQKAAAAKADFIGKVSHEIRTPLNAITGFTEVIMAERFGPIGNERYREYLKDMQAAETHLVALLNDLLDLSKIETGQLDLTFANVSLNELTQQCVGIMQPQASRARIIIRTSLTPGIPQVVADERSLRQIVLNLLSNSIKFTGPGGQVIVSTAFADSGEAVLRVRDTGVGMSEKDVEAALEPFRQTATSGSWGSGGTGLGLPLTKALGRGQSRAFFHQERAERRHADRSRLSADARGRAITRSRPPSACCLRHADDDFAEMRAGRHVIEGRLHLVEAEYAIDRRLDLVRGDGSVHRLEHLGRADGNALHVGALGEDQSRIELGRAAAHAADDADLAADADGAERARQRAGAADLDHVVDAAAAGEFDAPPCPIPAWSCS